MIQMLSVLFGETKNYSQIEYALIDREISRIIIIH